MMDKRTVRDDIVGLLRESVGFIYIFANQGRAQLNGDTCHAIAAHESKDKYS